MNFDKIKEILQNYGFFGFTVTKKDGKIDYTFRSISYFTITIIVYTIKVDKKEFGCDKLVTKMKFGDVEINDIKELLPLLKDINKIHKKLLYGKSYKTIEKNKPYNHHNNTSSGNV